ncbi:MAG TPA: FRG domain-containing protein [bacterium]|nr:FRG domain-containing protein [bacterium]
MNSINQKPCNDAHEFLEFLLPWKIVTWEGNYDVRPQLEDWIFRGQGQDIIPIPLALRKDNEIIIQVKKYLTKYAGSFIINEDSLQVGAEFDLLRDFLRAADWQQNQLIGYDMKFRDKMLNKTTCEYFMSYPNKWLKGNEAYHYKYLELVALAQHYRIPTRLLDWTERPLIAAYFAANRVIELCDKESNGENAEIVIWAMNRKVIENKTDEERITFIGPTMAMNSNLAAQRGILTLLKNGESYENLFKSYPKNIWKITLDKKHRFELLRQLFNMGIHAGTMFPSLEGAAKYAIERRYWPDNLLLDGDLRFT